jgi:hypothetical protein
LRECRKGGSEKQKQNCCTDDSILVHRYCLQIISHLPLTRYARHTHYTVCAHGCQFSTAHVLGQKCSSRLMGGELQSGAGGDLPRIGHGRGLRSVTSSSHPVYRQPAARQALGRAALPGQDLAEVQHHWPWVKPTGRNCGCA